ncbi:MAG: DUF3782 domain-containing protein [Spirochaetaceae bacterium]|nr:DUF3782 domain-containing protein [Spirochaetaceae bacterium]
MSEAHNEPLTFEKVWAALMEDRERMKELREQEAERQKEAARQTEELKKQIKETGRQISKLGNRFGELVEHLVAPGIVEKFNDIGFNFYEISPKGREFADPETRQFVAEVDIVLESRDTFMAIEVKSKLQKQDIDDHIARMKVLRRIADSNDDKRKYLGAVAGAIVTDEARNYARKSGFYVLEQSGDTMELVVPKGFVPREW